MAYCCECSPLWWNGKRKIKLIRYSGVNLKTMKFTFAIHLLLTPDILPSICIYKYMTTRESTASLTTSLHNIGLQITNVSPLQPSVSTRPSNIFQTMTAGSITSTLPLTTSLHNIIFQIVNLAQAHLSVHIQPQRTPSNIYKTMTTRGISTLLIITSHNSISRQLSNLEVG